LAFFACCLSLDLFQLDLFDPSLSNETTFSQSQLTLLLGSDQG
jgi:hypothetical protein